MQKLNLNSNSNDEYLNELRKNKELAAIDVNINNCNLLSRYLSDLEHCKKCRGLSECKNEPAGYKSKISQKGSYTNLTKIPCDFMNDYLKIKKYKVNLKHFFYQLK